MTQPRQFSTSMASIHFLLGVCLLSTCFVYGKPVSGEEREILKDGNTDDLILEELFEYYKELETGQDKEWKQKSENEIEEPNEYEKKGLKPVDEPLFVKVHVEPLCASDDCNHKKAPSSVPENSDKYFKEESETEIPTTTFSNPTESEKETEYSIIETTTEYDQPEETHSDLTEKDSDPDEIVPTTSSPKDSSEMITASDLTTKDSSEITAATTDSIASEMAGFTTTSATNEETSTENYEQ